MSDNKDLIKIKFKIDNYGNSAEPFIEVLWGERVNSTCARLDNSPFYAYGYSFNDIVSFLNQGDEYFVERIIKKGGHSTFRIFLNKSKVNDLSVLVDIEKVGCSWEQAKSRLFSIDVPPSVSIDKVVSILEKGEIAGLWEYEEGDIFEKSKS